MRRLILIDGENLNRGLRNLAGGLETPVPRGALESYDYRGLINEILGDEEKAQILYFGARLRRYNLDEELLKQSTEAIRLQAKMVNELQKQGISFVKVGYLRAREGKPCPECGHKKAFLTEKGVDVGLAVRMVTEAGPETEIVLFSADTDLLPAVKTAIKLGSKVIFVGYEYQPTLALSKAASLTRLISAPIAKKHLANQLKLVEGEVVDDTKG
ncbi:NYN domain-containing protein [Candidatus Saccharibacteria bacterium]|nr:NYN domain-containing protein [Candidatus Saccharibacteria bacterium]